MRPLVSTRRAFASVWADGVLSLGLLALGQYEVWGGRSYDGGPVFPGPQIVNAVAVVPLLALPLAFRRRAPLVSCGIVLGTIGFASFGLRGLGGTAQVVRPFLSVFP